MNERLLPLIGYLLAIAFAWVIFGFVCKAIVWLFCLGYGC